MEEDHVKRFSFAEKKQKTLACLLLCAGAISAHAADIITIGTVPNMGDGGLICAIERGYFAHQNIEVRITNFATASAMTALIARGDLTMVRGGVNVSYFNSVARGLPMRYFANSTFAPAYHALIMRAGLKESVHSARDLKGLYIGTTAIGGLSEYELGKTLESVGLSLNDVDTKPLGMPESVTAISNGALDGAVFVPPFDAEAIKSGGWKLLAPDEAVTPPMEVSGLVENTDWAAKNQNTLDRFTAAYIQGTRCYLEAAQSGANRDELIRYYLKYEPIKDPAIYAAMQWPGTAVDARPSIASLMDQQEFYARRGYLKTVLPAEKILDDGPVTRGLALLTK